MDFLDPSKQRANRNRLVLGYILIGIAIALVTAILVFQSYGYDLDRKTGSIIQNGLLFVAAQPEPADVYLNGKQYKSRSDARLVLPSDVYQLELKNTGYRTWKRTISLAGGTIERFVYPFLFPAKMTAKEQKTYSEAPTLTTQSPDRHWLLVQQPGKIGVFDEFDANDSKKAATSLTIPAALFAGSDQHQLQVVEWASDNRHFLVQDDTSNGRVFLVVDREAPDSSYSVNKNFDINPTEVALRDKRFDQLYVYDQTTKKVDLADSKDKSVKAVLSDVLAFKSHGADLILYATQDPATPAKTRIMLRDTDGSFLLREISTSPRYLLNLAQYSGHWYVAAGGTTDNAIFVYKDPQDTIKQTVKPTLPETALRLSDPNWLAFSANTQFIVLENGSQFAAYDFENQRIYRYDLKLPLDGEAPHASWMDGDRLLINSQGKLVVVDYDGTNLQTITTNQAGIIPSFDRQYKLLYTIAPRNGNDGFALNRFNLVVGKND